jgi:thiol:disulfide interchange protein
MRVVTNKRHRFPRRTGTGTTWGRGRLRPATFRAALLLAALTWATLAALPADAQQGVPQPGSALERPAKWSLTADSASGSAERPLIVLRAEVDEGWYLYALTQPEGGPQPLEIRLASGFGIAGDIDAPRPRTFPDRTFNLFTSIHRGDVSFTVPVSAEAAPTGERQITAYVLYQTCNDRYCLPPRTDTVTTMLPFEGSADDGAADRGGGDAGAASAVVGTDALPPPPPVPAEGTEGAEDPDGVEDAGLGSGEVDVEEEEANEEAATSALTAEAAPEPPALALFGQVAGGTPSGVAAMLAFLWLAFAMGLLSLLTPCVFPMVPLTVSYFGGEHAGGRATRIRDAALFGAGILVTFTAVGFGFAAVFGAGSVVRLAASPWTNLAIAGLFLLFALNLLGVLEFRLPTRLMRGTARLGTGGRAAGSTLMGGAFAITSFTCTAPFVGTLIVLATQGDWRWPLLGLAVYAGAFALPFFLLALAPGMLSRLPTAGPWILDLRRSLGVLEIALAVKFLSNADLVWGWGVLGRDAVIGVAIAAVVVIGVLALWRRHPTPPRLAAMVVCLIAAVWLSRGLQGYRLGELEALLPPAPHGIVLAGFGELPWHLNDYEASLQRAQGQQKPLLVDFTGYTCTNCRWMEANMFPRRDVRTLLDEYVRVRLYTDGRGAVYEQQQRMQQDIFGTVALPYYAIITPDGRPVATFLGMTRDEDEFARFLAAGLPAPDQP